MTTHLAAIREAAERIGYAVPGLEGPLAGPIGDEAETILRLLDAAEKDSTCIYVNDPEHPFTKKCNKCGYHLEFIYSGDTFCPGCGRRIVKEDAE
jgi:rubrerythrin